MNRWQWDPVLGDLVQGDLVQGDLVQGDLVQGDLAGPLRLADSWLVEDGRVRAFDRHRKRFEAGARQLGVEEAGDPDFWQAILALLPADGAWFPRVEIAGSDAAHLGFRLRPAPERLREARVWIPPFTDPRQHRDLKGPDLALLVELRNRARRDHHCDEVLLVDCDGFVVEAANSNILWWEGDTLCVPDPGLSPFEGITIGLILEEASRQSIAIRGRRATVEDMWGREVWLTSALHGVRRVTGWSGRPRSPGESPGETPRFARWHHHLGAKLSE